MNAKIYPSFNLDFFKMGYFIVYLNGGDFVGNRIENAQLRKGFTEEQARAVHVECSGGGHRSVYIRMPKSKAIDIRKAHAGREIVLVKYREYDDDIHDRLRYKVAYNSALLCNLPYDWRGVLRFNIPFLSQMHDKPFCSEGNLWSLQEVFPNAIDGIEPYRAMPAHFLLSNFWEVVWKGRIPPINKPKGRWSFKPINKSLFGESLKYGGKVTYAF